MYLFKGLKDILSKGAFAIQANIMDKTDRLIVKVTNRSGNPLPKYETSEAAGMDVCAFLERDLVLEPMKRALIPTGLAMQIPRGYECQFRPRSGLALKHGITVLNSPGTIDADSRAELGVILINLSDKPFTIRNGDRVCQLLFKKCDRAEWELVRELDHTKRGDGSFGDSGL